LPSLQLSPREAALIEEAKRRGLIGARKPKPYAEWYQTTIPKYWAFPRHIQFLCDLAQQVVDGKIQKVALSIPPGHGKSTTITQRLPVYWGLTHPKDTTVLTGYSSGFAEKNLSKPSREVAAELGILDPRTTAMEEWNLTNGARIIARGVGAAPTGINPITLLVADDPIKDRQQANSAIERQNIKDWWDGSIVQRFWPETRAFVIATRWHHDDLIGHIKSKDDGSWTFINLPAIAGEDDPVGRLTGEALWPEGKPLKFLESIRQNNPWEFEALFQGNPTPREGSMFKVDSLAYIDRSEIPTTNDIRWVRAWDVASSAGKGDYTAGVLMGVTAGGRFLIADVVRGQWATDERRQVILQTAKKDGPLVMVCGPEDPGAAGKDAVLDFVRLLAGYTVRIRKADKKKELRADPFSAQVNGHNVALVRAPWNTEYVDELRSFPLGKHDDQVDASSDAFNELAGAVDPWDWF
jgi:predicted phage terminase large subunit-like protein